LAYSPLKKLAILQALLVTKLYCPFNKLNNVSILLRCFKFQKEIINYTEQLGAIEHKD